jgi:hypothetical protein
MLRFLMPTFAAVSPVAIKLGQKLMAAFVFQKAGDEAISEETKELIAKFLVELSVPKAVTSQLPACDINKLLQFSAENVVLLAEKLETTVADQEHPLRWSIIEMIESVVFGLDEDFSAILANGCYKV